MDKSEYKSEYVMLRSLGKLSNCLSSPDCSYSSWHLHHRALLGATCACIAMYLQPLLDGLHRRQPWSVTQSIPGNSIPGIWQFPYIWHLTISKHFSEQSGFPSRTKLLPFGVELRSWMTRTDWVGSESFLALRILWLFCRCASTPALIWIHLAPNS